MKTVDRKIGQNKSSKVKLSDDENIKLNEIKLEMFQIQIYIITEKENQLKMKVEKNKNTINLDEILVEDEEEQKENSIEDNFEDANDNEEEFYQSSIVSPNKSSIANFSINPLKAVSGLVQKDSVEVQNIKKSMLDLSREKSSIRNKIVSKNSIIFCSTIYPTY